MGEGKQILHALRLGCFAEKLYFCEVNPTETMKKFLILLYATTCLSATAAAQARFTSNTARHSLGQIEWKHPVTADFLVTNTGNQQVTFRQCHIVRERMGKHIVFLYLYTKSRRQTAHDSTGRKRCAEINSIYFSYSHNCID